jgi:hypothetical protein
MMDPELRSHFPSLLDLMRRRFAPIGVLSRLGWRAHGRAVTKSGPAAFWFSIHLVRSSMTQTVDV